MDKPSNSSDQRWKISLVFRSCLDLDLLVMLLNQVGKYDIPVAANSIQTFREQSSNEPVDLLLADPSFSNLESWNLCRETLREKLATRVLVLDQAYTPKHAKLAEQLPAVYCSRSVGVGKLLSMIRSAMDGEPTTPNADNGLVECQPSERIDANHSSLLTPRQMQVLTLFAEGKTGPECAAILGLSKSTIENHRARLMGRLGLKRKVDLVRWAIRTGLIDP